MILSRFVLCNMDYCKPAKELHDAKGQDGQRLKAHVLKKCVDDLKRSNDIYCQNVCVNMIYNASLEYDKEMAWGDFAGLVILSHIEELKKHSNHVRKLQARNEELQKRNKELEKRIDALEQQNDEQNQDSSSEPEAEAALQKTTAKPQG